MGGSSPDPVQVAGQRDLLRLTRRVGEVETLLGQLAADVTALAQLAGAQNTDPPDGAGPAANPVTAWLLTHPDPDTGADPVREVVADLVEWLARVYLRYPRAALPSCWVWHPAVVEELLWLRGAHHDAYTGPEASWARAGDWHDRMRPGVVRRIQDAYGGCELILHLPDGEQAGPAPTVPLAGCAARVGAAFTTGGTPPDPTPAQLAEAQRHDRAQHHNHH